MTNSGDEANGPSAFGDLSSTGRFVAFESLASNVVSGDTNDASDVFVYDRESQIVQRISVGTAGVPGDGGSFAASISADGRYVAFESLAENLVAGDANGLRDVFVYDRQLDAIEVVSVDGAGNQADGESLAPAISDDGRFVAFESDATNLVPGDTNGVRDVFVFDRQTASIERVSVGDSGEGNGSSREPSLSADGRFVAFDSAATNLISGDTNGNIDVFVYDRAADSLSRVSTNSGGLEANGTSTSPQLSANGRFVVFESNAGNLVAGDFVPSAQIYVHDRESTAVSQVSVNRAGNPAVGDSA